MSGSIRMELYLGNGEVIEASSTQKGVTIAYVRDMDETEWVANDHQEGQHERV